MKRSYPSMAFLLLFLQFGESWPEHMEKLSASLWREGTLVTVVGVRGPSDWEKFLMDSKIYG